MPLYEAFMVYDFVRKRPNYYVIRTIEDVLRFIFNLYWFLLIRSWCYRLFQQQRFVQIMKKRRDQPITNMTLSVEIRELREEFGGLNPRTYDHHTNLNYPYIPYIREVRAPQLFNYYAASAAIEAANNLQELRVPKEPIPAQAI